MDPLLISIAVFVAVVLAIVAVLFVMEDFGPSKVEDRLQMLTNKKGAEAEEERKILKREMLKEGVGGMSQAFNRFASGWEPANRTADTNWERESARARIRPR